MELTFQPSGPLFGRVKVPADKSIAHRALILAALGSGVSEIEGAIAGEDVGSTARCAGVLGAGVSRDETTTTISGNGWQPGPAADLDCGNSGTTMRLLSGALAGRPGRFVLRGDESLSRRPMGRVAVPLRAMGAQVELTGGTHAPVTVCGGALRGITHEPEVASAQVKSAILLAGLQAEGATTVVEPLPTRDHTERFMTWLGADLETSGGQIRLRGGGPVIGHPGFRMAVPGDLSSAAFFLVAAALLPDSDLLVTDVGLNPGRTGILEILEAMGARLEVSISIEEPEPLGIVRVVASPLGAVEVAGPLIPRTIDELPLVALAATQAEGVTVIKDAADLRAKESDRISVVAGNLRALGAQVEETPDGMLVTGPTKLRGGVVDAHHDHRMAMTFAVAGLIASEPVTVTGWEAARVSFPGFEDTLKGLLR